MQLGSLQKLPIYKSGNANDEANYRLISVLTVLSKILKAAIYNQLITYMENNHLLTNQQFGYITNRSTEQAATLFLITLEKRSTVENLQVQ